jgi:hypothetical protein
LRGEVQGDCEFLGTVEFFPEEGKYHMDGHRKCNWSMEPGETVANRGLCPVCGKPATLGVLHRVLALADRPEPVQPEGQPGYDSLIPLRRCSRCWTWAPAPRRSPRNTSASSPPWPGAFILREAPLPDIRRTSPVLAEAVERMRAGKVLRKSGFDGEFGVITVFTPEERAEMRHGGRLVAGQAQRGRRRSATAKAPRSRQRPTPSLRRKPGAATRPDGPEPGPGPGRVRRPGPASAGRAGQARPTSSAAWSLLAGRPGRRPGRGDLHPPRRRTCSAWRPPAGPGEPLPLTDTLHALALALWTVRRGQPPVLLSEDAARKLFVEALPESLSKPEREALFRRHSLARSLAPCRADG